MGREQPRGIERAGSVLGRDRVCLVGAESLEGRLRVWQSHRREGAWGAGGSGSCTGLGGGGRESFVRRCEGAAVGHVVGR